MGNGGWTRRAERPIFYFFIYFFIEKPQTFRHVNVHMIYSVHTYVSRRQHGNGSGGEAWAARPTVGLGVNTGQTHGGGGGSLGDKG